MTDTALPKRPAPARWSEDEEARLSEAFRSGTPLAEIAAAHNRSIGAITSRLQLLDLLHYGPYNALISGPTETSAETSENAGKAWTETEIAQLLITHHSQGSIAALTDLAKQFGRTPRALALKLVQLGTVKPDINPDPKPQPREKPAPKPPKVTMPTPTTRTVKITVTPEFQTAARAVEEGENLLILGSAGTGKSTFLKWLRKQIGQSKSYAVLAPTGMAALNVGGQTIHSFMGFKPQLITNSSGWHKPRNPKVFEKLDLLIVDEISMVRADTFSAMDTFLRTYGRSRSKPFGGVQMLLMGDLCQLPPVVRRDEEEVFSNLFGSPFFFSTPAFISGQFGIVEFTHIFRQSDEPFINLLNRVRKGERDWGLVDTLNRRLTQSPPAGAVILAARNRTVDAINQRELDKLPSMARTYLAHITGDVDPNAFTTAAELTLKVGARVMFTRNDKEGRWVNGSLGTITKLAADYVEVELPEGTVEVLPEKWEAIKYKALTESGALEPTVSGTFTQFPLTLAWALTIHKAQGQTLNNCVLDLSDGGTFAEGQLYVALSRARSLDSIHLTQPIQQKDIRTNPAVLDFYQSLSS